MDIQSEKYHLIQQIIELQDSAVIKKIRDFLNKETVNDDWYHKLSSSEKDSISKGLQDLQDGNTVSHKEVLSSVKNKIAALKQQ
jgi:predicted transcriptional regulator